VAKKKSSSNKFISFLTQMSGGFTPPNTIGKITLDTDGQTSISKAERETLLARIQERTSPSNKSVGLDSYGKYIRPMTNKIAELKLDNEAMAVLAPEIRTAMEIVIPSIMSPTDLKEGEISILSTSTAVDEETNNRVAKLLDEYFNKRMKLSTKLPEWIREGLYGAGAKPIMVLPITEIDTIMNDPNAVISRTVTTKTTYSNEALAAAMEAWDNLDRIESQTIFGLSDSAQQRLNKDTVVVADLRPSMEAAIHDFLGDAMSTNKIQKPEKSEAPYNLEDKFKGGNYKELKTFVGEAIEGISIVDNPDILKKDKAKKAKSKAQITQQVTVHYKSLPLMTLNPEDGPSKGNPVVYELPPESVIPIFTPGTPSDHIGYFIALDEHGNPIHVTEDARNKDLADGRRTSPGALYKSFGLESQYSFGGHTVKNERNHLMVGIYQSVIEAHLKGRLKNGGIDNVYIGAPENVYRCLFARYMAARKTKLLFVPKDFMTYFCFRYNEDGTGRSKIEDIKFVLSLKVTLLICRMMANMNSAINRKKINIDFTEEMGDPIQYIEMVKKEAIDKSMVNFSWDPTEITRTIAQRAISVQAKGIPGAENFNISSEPNEVRDIKPDNELFDDLNNMMVLGLDVPPSAMNLLNENEFSRSVATNNLFFSRRIAAAQQPVCEHTARHIKVYTLLSEELKDQIRDILKQGAEDKDKRNKEAGTVDDDKLSVDEKLTDIIQHIVCKLPSPDVAPNKTEFEELDSMIQSMATALEGVFDNDLASDDPLPLIRALVKSDMVREYMQKIGVSKDANIATLDAVFIERLVSFKQQLINATKGIKEVIAKTSIPPTDGDTTSTGGQGF
jgi:hypothetical protein